MSCSTATNDSIWIRYPFVYFDVKFEEEYNINEDIYLEISIGIDQIHKESDICEVILGYSDFSDPQRIDKTEILYKIKDFSVENYYYDKFEYKDKDNNTRYKITCNFKKTFLIKKEIFDADKGSFFVTMWEKWPNHFNWSIGQEIIYEKIDGKLILGYNTIEKSDKQKVNYIYIIIFSTIILIIFLYNIKTIYNFKKNYNGGIKMKEFEKIILEDEKRKLMIKAIDEIKLGLFEQKEETSFDYTLYNKMTYNKKYKGLYDLYQNKETNELLMVCPLVENNKDDYNERKDLVPYAYDILYLEYLDDETYNTVKKATVHEKTKLIDIFHVIAIVFYFIYTLLTIGFTLYYIVTSKSLTDTILIFGTLWAGLGVYTALLPILLMRYRQFKAE